MEFMRKQHEHKPIKKERELKKVRDYDIYALYIFCLQCGVAHQNNRSTSSQHGVLQCVVSLQIGYFGCVTQTRT